MRVCAHIATNFGNRFPKATNTWISIAIPEGERARAHTEKFSDFKYNARSLQEIQRTVIYAQITP